MTKSSEPKMSAIQFQASLQCEPKPSLIGGQMTKSSKKYKVIPTKEQLKIIKEGWKRFRFIQDNAFEQMGRIEKNMSKETGIKGLQLLHDEMCMGWYGIGNVSRTMPLLQREELEK